MGYGLSRIIRCSSFIAITFLAGISQISASINTLSCTWDMNAQKHHDYIKRNNNGIQTADSIDTQISSNEHLSQQLSVDSSYLKIKSRFDFINIDLSTNLMFNAANSTDSIGNGEPYLGYDSLCVDTDPPPNCTSNDFEFLEAYLGSDTLGTRLSNCTFGVPTQAYFCLRFNKTNGANRRGFYISATISDGDSSLYYVNQCFDETFKNQGIFTLCIPNQIITFTCGTNLKIVDAYFGWGSSSASSNICNQSSGCASPKCDYIQGESTLSTPLVANFDYTVTCPAFDTLQAIELTNNTTGGSSNYTYLWDFGDGDTSSQANPVHFYSDTGKFTVQLIVNDDLGFADTATENNIEIYAAASVEAGSISKPICSHSPIDLNELNASINGGVSTGYWTTNGTGTFDNNGDYGGGSPATTYTFSQLDINIRQVVLSLISHDPPGICEPASDDLLIVINDVECHEFPFKK